MKSFLSKFLIFLIPILLVIFSLDIFLRQMPSIYQQKRDQLLTNADSIEILILGSSHEMDGVNPNYFSLYAHNLAFGAQSIYFDKELAKKYIPQLKKLKYAILEFGYNSLTFEHVTDRDFFYDYYYGISFKGKKYYKEYLSQSLFVYNPKVTINLILEKFKTDFPAPQKKGWAGSFPDSMAEPSPFENKMSVMQYYNNLQEGENVETSVLADLECLIQLLKSNNITPILLTTPYYKSFRANLTDKKPFEKVDSIGNYLTQKYNILHLNYFEDNSFEITDFHNYSHLNKFGAKKLTLKLDSVIMNIDKNSGQ